MEDSGDLFRFIPNNPEEKSSKRSADANTLYSYMKIPSKGTKIIRIQIYDVEQLQNNEDKVCKCNANLCIQHVVQNLFRDDIYRDVTKIITQMKEQLSD
ncbi:unnamed protein product, partial [Brenthis ino]